MPYLPHTLIAWGGSWNGPNEVEEWACTLKLAGVIDADEPVHQQFCEDIADEVVVFHSGTSIPSGAHLRFVKVNPIGPDGKYIKQTTTFQRDYTSPVPGGNPSGIIPLQNTIATTLRTVRTRGIGSRGRFYPPGVAAAELDAFAFLTNARQTARASACVAFIASLNATAAAAGIGPVSVVSAGANAGTGPGASVPVTAVDVGRVVDTQRRRRASLSEDTRVVLEVTLP